MIRKRILLGVTGGIAAYKSAELTRLLRSAGAEVRIVMTEAATAFVGPLTFQALSGNPVHLRLLDSDAESAMGHIELARWAERIVIAPASADVIAKLRAGLADDLLSTLCLAAEAPIAVAPAMNRAMWDHPATRDNIAVLASRGIDILGPASGELACGEVGFGRMLEPADILAELERLFRPGPLAGLSVLISAGPTREPIDPVRYISNRSSGKMGYALARAARSAGARVTLVSGPVSSAPPIGVQMVMVETAADMHRAVLDAAPLHDIYIGAAAVADYTPAQVAEHKIKKRDAELTIALRRTQDILGDVAQLARRPFTVGFAAETDQLQRYARDKLSAKALDMIAANRVGDARGGFDSDDNELTVYWADGERHLPMTSKAEIAKRLIDLIKERHEAKNSAEAAR